ncbi:MAG: alanine racemase [Anaerolineales bacterium]
MMTITDQTTWIEVDLGAIAHNVRRARQLAGVPLMAIVKANAYGHGALPVARAALRAGAEWLGVARLEEALALRHDGLTCPILILGYTPPALMPAAAQADVSLTVWTAEQIEQAAEAAARSGKAARLHLKIDSGMHRLGAPPEQAHSLGRQIAAAGGLVFEGLFTHFARADEADPRPTDEQQARFQAAIAALEAADLRPRWVHAANSAAVLRRTDARYDLARLGIAMYGLRPSAEAPLPADFRPALAWKAVLSHVKSVPPGSGVGYGHRYVTTRQERIGTVPLGYADGFRRVSGNLALVAGQRVPVIGSVCMDQMMVQLDAAPQAAPGDEVVLIGEQGGERLSAEEVAAIWGTINYEVVCAIGGRVPRVYLDG